MSTEPYNFRKPGRLAGDFEQRLASWLRDSCALASATWARHMAFRVEISLRELEIVRPGDAFSRLPDTAIAYQVGIEGEPLPTLLILPRPLALLLVAGMLGDPGTETPADRELTVVEESLYEYSIQDLLVAVLQETWPGAASVQFKLRHKEPSPKRSRMFPPDEKVVTCSFAVAGPFGEQEWHWMLPHEGLLELFMRSGPGQGASHEDVVRPRLEVLLRDCALEISVQLGAARLPLHQLTRLRVGDLVILDQRVHEPLAAFVAGEQKFKGWPGRAGARQAFQIDSSVEL